VTSPPIRRRREPPAFRTLDVRGTTPVTPRLVRVTLGGDELSGMALDLPAASVRLLLPPAGATELVMPAWNGNEFLMPDGTRPLIRTLTPRRLDPEAGTLDVEVVVHRGGALPAWVARAGAGDRVAVSGPGRGYAIDTEASDYLLAGDETAIPAIGQLLEHVPPAMPVRVLVEVADPEARLALTHRADVEVTWLDLPPGDPPGAELVDAVAAADVGPGTRVWAAGEAAAVQRIRRGLLEDRGIPRSRTAVRGYWKQGRAEDGDGGV
jgi:NADPH-dependent ferric siderophore reductase